MYRVKPYHTRATFLSMQSQLMTCHWSHGIFEDDVPRGYIVHYSHGGTAAEISCFVYFSVVCACGCVVCNMWYVFRIIKYHSFFALDSREERVVFQYCGIGISNRIKKERFCDCNFGKYGKLLEPFL